MKQYKNLKTQAMLQLFKPAATVLSWVHNFVYPPNCINCGLLLSHHDALCTHCWNEVQFIMRPIVLLRDVHLHMS